MTPQPLRIVYLIGQLGLGGSERQLYLLLKHMDKSRFEPHVVVFNLSSNYTLDEDLRQAGVTVHAIPTECKGIQQRMLWIYRLLRQVHPHVVHSWSIHDNAYAGIVGVLAGVPRRLGSVRDSLGTPDFQQFSPIIRWLILHSVQGLLVNSDEIVNELHAAGISSERIQMLPNCVDTSQSRQIAKLVGIPPNVRMVGLVANQRRKKNHVMFIRGLAQVLSEFPDVYGVMIGQSVLTSDPEVPEQIQSEIKALGVQERIQVTGFHGNVPALLQQFEIFCLTSDFEGTPNAVLEAMAAGLPVIATCVGGIPHIVQDGVTGLLIKPGDVNGLAEALHILLSQPEKARMMGMAGRERVEKEFGCQTLIRDFEEYYLG